MRKSASGTSLRSDRRKQRQALAHPEDIVDLARASSRFALEMRGGEDRAAGESFGHLLLRRSSIPEPTIADALGRATTAPRIALSTDPVPSDPFRWE